MGIPWKVRMVHWHAPTPLLMLPHYHTGDEGKTHLQNSTVSSNNGTMPAMSSADVETDAARRLAVSLSNTAMDAPFARFGAQTMDTI